MHRGNKLKIESPCVGTCFIDDLSGLCIGCFRTAKEITIWPQIKHEKAKKILNDIKNRKLLNKLN